MAYSDLILGTTGLLSYYRCEETTGTTLADSKGSLTLTLAGGYTLGVAGIFGNAVTYNGSTGQAATTGAPTGFPAGAAARTVECWIKTNTAVSSNTGICSYGTNSSGQFFSLYLFPSNNLAIVSWFSTLQAVAPNTVADGNWHHFVGTYDGTTRRIYWDGQLVTSDTAALSTTLGTNPFTVGYAPGGDPHFNGSVDEVAVYSVALDLATIRSHYQNNPLRQLAARLKPSVSMQRVRGEDAAALLLCWPLAELGGTVLLDPYASTRNGSMATDTTAPTRTTGLHGPCLAFNGTAQFATGPAFTTGTTSAFEVLCQPTTIDGTQRCVLLANNGQNTGWMLNTDGTWGFNVPGVTTFASGVAAQVGRWDHILVSFSPSGAKVYYNGAPTATFAQTASFTATNCRLGSLIGANFFGGRIALVRVWKTPLSAARVAALAADPFATLRHAWPASMLTPLSGKFLRIGMDGGISSYTGGIY